MLHRLTHPSSSVSLMVGLIVLLGAPWAPSRGQAPRGLLSQGARVDFAKQHLQPLVEIRRRCPPIATRVVPFRGPALGWRVGPGRVLTVARLAEGWPAHEEDVIEVKGPGGVWRPAAPGLMDARQGLAILDTGASAPGEEARSRLGPPATSGWTGWALIPPAGSRAAGAVPIPITGRAPSPYSFYWWSPGRRLLAGTPILDLDGRLRAMVAPPLWGIHEEEGVAIVPTAAVKAVLEARSLWVPIEKTGEGP